VAAVFSGLSALVIEDVADDGEMIRVLARTRDVSFPCPMCGVPTGKVHGYHVRTVADVPVDGRRVVVKVRVRRLVCPVPGCRRQTFREQVPGLIERLQRRTTRLTSQVSGVGKELCGRAAARLAGLLAVPNQMIYMLDTAPPPARAAPPTITPGPATSRNQDGGGSVVVISELGTP
jgi:transposase